MGTNPFEPGTVFATKPCGPVQAFQVVDRNDYFDISGLPNPFAIGRIAQPGEMPRAEIQLRSEQVSLIHAEIERRGERLWYRDKGSLNGTYIHNARVDDDISITRGMIFRVADVSLIALDALQTELRPRLAWTLGLDAHGAINHNIARIAQDNPLLIVGPRGHEAEQLARMIHDTSGRRDYPFRSFTTALPRVADELVREAKWGTVFVELHEVGESFAELVVGRKEPALCLRPIIAVPSVKACHKLLGRMAAEQAIEVPTMRERRLEIPRLIDVAMADEKATCKTKELGRKRVTALTRPSLATSLTLESLREVATRVRAVLEEKTEEAAAARLGITRQALNSYFHRLFGE